MSQRITKTIFLTATEAAVYKSTGTCQHVTPDGDTITVSDTDTDCIVYCPEDEPVTRAELAEAVKHHYSTIEQVVGTWIDGKPIYEKVIEKVNSMASSNFEWVSNFINTSDIPIDELIDCWLKLDNGRCTPTQVKYNGTNIDFLFGTNQSVTIQSQYAVIQFTKTTD